MMSCREATRLLSEGQDRTLGLGERVSLKMHLAICIGCANYRRQMEFLRQACRGYADALLAARQTDKNDPGNS